MEESSRLQKLRQENEERWKTLKELHKQCNDDTDTSSTDDADTTTANKPSRVLKVELEMIQSKNNMSEELNLNFLQELVTSYDDLRQTNAILDRDIQREQNKLESMEQTISQFKAVHDTLIVMNKSDQESSVQDNRNNVDDEEENEWIRNEVRYVSNLLHGREKKRRRLEDNEANGTRKQEKSTWNLDHLVLELMERCLASPLDPYVLTSSLPVEHWQLDLLKQCGVIRVHPSNSDLVCLSNYRGNTS